METENEEIEREKNRGKANRKVFEKYDKKRKDKRQKC